MFDFKDLPVAPNYSPMDEWLGINYQCFEDRPRNPAEIDIAVFTTSTPAPKT